MGFQPFISYIKVYLMPNKLDKTIIYFYILFIQFKILFIYFYYSNKICYHL